jgi:hypothetical protein
LFLKPKEGKSCKAQRAGFNVLSNIFRRQKMGDKTITQIVETGDGNSGTVTVLTKDESTGTEKPATRDYGGSVSKAEAIDRATQDSLNKH